MNSKNDQIYFITKSTLWDFISAKVFTKTVVEIIVFYRQINILMVPYLDDIFLFAESNQLHCLQIKETGISYTTGLDYQL